MTLTLIYCLFLENIYPSCKIASYYIYLYNSFIKYIVYLYIVHICLKRCPQNNNNPIDNSIQIAKGRSIKPTFNQKSIGN